MENYLMFITNNLQHCSGENAPFFKSTDGANSYDKQN